MDAIPIQHPDENMGSAPVANLDELERSLVRQLELQLADLARQDALEIDQLASQIAKVRERVAKRIAGERENCCCVHVKPLKGVFGV